MSKVQEWIAQVFLAIRDLHDRNCSETSELTSPKRL